MRSIEIILFNKIFFSSIFKREKNNEFPSFWNSKILFEFNFDFKLSCISGISSSLKVFLYPFDIKGDILKSEMNNYK